jgi:hypothetical protein
MKGSCYGAVYRSHCHMALYGHREMPQEVVLQTKCARSIFSFGAMMSCESQSSFMVSRVISNWSNLADI